MSVKKQGRTLEVKKLIMPVLFAACSQSAEPAPPQQHQAPLRTEDGYQVIEARRPTKAPPTRNDELVREPTSPDPEAGEYTVEEAVAEMPLDGPLVAELNFDLGTLFCDLDAERAPNAVAAFIGLARGRRPFWDPARGAWARSRFYDGIELDSVIPEQSIAGGDRIGDGTYEPGFEIAPDAPPPDGVRRHDVPGRLSIDGARFAITDGRASSLDATHRVIGQCMPTDLVAEIARVPQGEGHRPLTDVRIARVRIRRVAGGAAAAQPTPPTVPPELEGTPREASPGPSELHRSPEERAQ